MRLARIKLSHVRKLDPGCLIDDLSPGLNIIGGDNEEGKSSLLLALKCAFFLSHATSGQLRERLVPHGSGLTPEIEVDFQLGGKSCTMVKPFKKDGMRLQVGEQAFKNAEAEAELERLLRFSRPGKAPKELVGDHLGLTGLFWVDQGTSFAGAQPTEDDQRRFGDLLSQEIGQAVTGEDADRVLAAARARAERYWTANGRAKASGPLAEATAVLARAEAEVAELDAKVRELDGHFTKLERLCGERRRVRADDQAGRIKAKLRDARARADRLRELLQEKRVKEQAVKAAQGLRERQGAARLARFERAKAVSEGRQELQAAGQDTLACRQAVGIADAERGRLDVQLKAVAASAVEAETALAAAERRRERDDARRQLAQCRERLTALDALDKSLAGLRARLAANRLDAGMLERLRAADRERSEARAELRAVATRIEFEPDGGKEVRVDGRPVDALEPLDLSAPARIELAGFGAIRVMPGGNEIRATRQKLERSAAEFAQLASEVGIQDLAQAEALARDREADRGEEKRLAGERKRLLDGETSDDVATRLVVLEARLAELAELPEAADEASIDTLRQVVRDRRTAVEDARAAFEVAASGYNDARTQEAIAQTRLAERQARLDQSVAVLEAERAQVGDEELAKAEQAAIAEEHRLHNELAILLASTGDAELAPVEDEIAMHERALAALEEEEQTRAGRIRELELLIQQQGGIGLGEQLDAAQERKAALMIEVERLSGEAAALKLLVETLSSQHGAARDRFTGPIRDRLLPLIRQVLPGATPVIDAQQVTLAEIERDGRAEALAELSLGTREQLAVLVRLAFADLLLQQEGEAPPIILDDALVYADENRLDAMKLLLQQKAREHQIIVLTCRPGDYRGLDAKRYDLSDCRLS